MSLSEITRIQHPDDVREALRFRGQPQGLNLEALYAQALCNQGSKFSKSDLRIAWKLASDSYYWPAFLLYPNIKKIEEAGFYDDGLDPGELKPYKDFRHLTTPLETIRQKLKQLQQAGCIYDKPVVVMLTTGGFAPAHEGHIAMMKAGKKALQDKGYNVLGGFMSLDHDNYVGAKGNDARRLSADFRTLLLDKILEDYDWLDVDPWSSRYVPTDVNFTDVVNRMRTYVNAHLNAPVDIKIAYVFGGDNAPFTRVFPESNDVAVCVARPGESKAIDLAEKRSLAERENIIFTESTNIDKSSKRIRSGELPPISQLAQDENWVKWLKGEPRKASTYEDKAVYLVRNDLSWATSIWKDKVDQGILERVLERFRDGLACAIKNAFKRSKAHGYPERVSVVHLPLEKQIEIVDRLMAIEPERIVNNDLITNGERNTIGLSRLFELSGSQVFVKKIISRIAGKDLKEILGRFIQGSYTFVDDDIATGTTLRLIEEQLPKGIQFSKKISLSAEVFKDLYPNDEYSFWDIIDARDFLMGSRKSGLVVQLFNGGTARATYMLPYTSLINRVGIPPDQEKSFSYEILNLNSDFHKDIQIDLKLKDTDPEFQKLMRSIGFRDQTRLSDVCAWHQQISHR